MEAVLVDIKDYEYSGEGANGTSYNHKLDKGIMIKLYNSTQPIKNIIAEYTLAHKVYDAGIPTPRPGDFITDGTGRYGIMFQRVSGKKSFCRAVSQDPENIEKYAREFAQLCKVLHSTKVDTSMFLSVKKTYYEMLESNPFYTQEERTYVKALIDSCPDGEYAIHGDLHFGNALISDEGMFFIDLGDFSYGHPYFDLGQLLLCCLYNTEEFTREVFHISNEMAARFWFFFVKEYFGEDADHDAIEQMLRPYAGLKSLMIEKFAGCKMPCFRTLMGI